MKRVTFVISSLGSGGAERVISVLSNELVKRDIDVTVILVNNNNVYYPISDAVSLVMLECEKDTSLSALKRFSLRIRKIKEAIKASTPDVVISFLSEINIDVCLAMLWNKIPLIVSERNDPKVDPPSKAKQLLRKMLYSRPQGFVFQTEDARNFFSPSIRKRSAVIFNPLSPTLPEMYTGERRKAVVSVGRLNKQKNYPLLFDAFEIFSKGHPEYTLEIYGEGVLEEQLKTDAQNRESIFDKIIFKGFCGDVHEKIRDASMFVMTSDFEGMPNALIEAMAIGLPVISTDCPCGGPRMLVEQDTNGILTPLKDSEAIAAAMSRYADDGEFSHSVGIEAYKIREKLSQDIITDEWLEFIKKTIG